MTLKPNKKRIALILTTDEIKTIKEIARKEGLSFSDKIRRILDDYLADHLSFNDKQNGLK